MERSIVKAVKPQTRSGEWSKSEGKVNDNVRIIINL